MLKKLRQILPQNPRFWQAIRLGIGVTVASLICYVVLLDLWPYDQTDPTERLITQLAIGQVFTGFAAILLTTILGSFAVWEFMERRSVPDLVLRFADTRLDSLDGTSHLVVAGVDPNYPDVFSIGVVLENRGPITAVWYRFEIRVPFMMKEGQFDHANFVGHEGVTTDHWSATKYYEESTIGVTFSSKGTAVAYPHWPMQLVIFRIPCNRAAPLPRDYICSYTLVTDGAPVKKGELRLTLR